MLKANTVISRIIIGSMFFIPLCGSLGLGPVIAITDPTLAKEFLIILSTLSIGILSLTKGECQNKGHRNWPLYALILFLPISIYCAPPIKLEYHGENMGGFWMWKSLAWALLYWILYESIVRIDFNKKAVGKAICGAALITTAYALIQAAGFDQFQFVRHNTVIGSPTSSHITGMIGNPTYLSIWLVMCVPFIIAYCRWYWWIPVAAAIVLCKSDIGIGGLLLMCVLWPAFRAKRKIWLIHVVGVGILAIVALVVFWGQLRPKITDNGRFPVWEQTIKDIQGPCILMPVRENMTPRQKIEVQNLNKRTYVLTGRGLGSFPFMFGTKYSSKYDSAHNDYLDIPYAIGLIGLAIFLVAVGFILWVSFLPARGDLFLSACYLSFFYSCIAAFGIPLWQEEPLRYFSAMMFIFLSTKK